MQGRFRFSVYAILGASLVLIAVMAYIIILFRNGISIEEVVQGSKRDSTVERLEKPKPPAADYVGGLACKRCHAEIWERYQSHPKSHSASEIGNAEPVEDFDRNPSFKVSTPIGEMEYRIERLPNEQFHHETLNDPILGQIFDQRVPMSNFIGSGHRGRSYLLSKNECLFMSPIGWYSLGSKWDLSPSYPPGNHPRFERRVPQACIVCHATTIPMNRDEPNRFPATAILEYGISCERCHGPGAGHIAFHDQKDHPATSTVAAVDSIVNPVKLDHNQRESVCWQCHFSSEAREPRYGRIDSDFRPGMNFDEIWVAFVRDSRTDLDGPVRAVSQVEQTLASKCFQQSNGRFGCLSCHDPHSVPKYEERETFYREKCLACHNDHGCAVPVAERIRQNEKDSCTACHMPAKQLNSVPHTSQTDHRVIRRPLTAPTTASESQLTVFNYGGRKIPQVEQDRAWGLVLAKAAEKQNDLDLAWEAEQKLVAVKSSVPDDTEVLEWLGACESQLGRIENARTRWLEILNKQPRNEGALRRLADLYMACNDQREAHDMLIRYLEVNPWQGMYFAKLAAVQGRLGDFEAAIQAANQALSVNPTLAWVHGILAEVYQRQGNQNEARRHMELYRKIDPPKRAEK